MNKVPKVMSNLMCLRLQRKFWTPKTFLIRGTLGIHNLVNFLGPLDDFVTAS